jgi:chromosome segregation ATPase
MTTTPSTLAQPQDVLKRSISTLRVLDDELGNLEDLKAERAKEERNLELWTHNVKAMKGEFDEAKRAHDKVAKEAWEKQHELDRLNAEIKAKTAELSSITGQLNKIRQQLGG